MRKAISILLAILMIISLPFVSFSGDAWYDGGTLHRALANGTIHHTQTSSQQQQIGQY